MSCKTNVVFDGYCCFMKSRVITMMTMIPICRQWFVSGSRQHMDLVIVLDWSRQMVQRMVGHFTMWELGRWVVRYLLTGITPFDDRVCIHTGCQHLF